LQTWPVAVLLRLNLLFVLELENMMCKYAEERNPADWITSLWRLSNVVINVNNASTLKITAITAFHLNVVKNGGLNNENY
jgi:hypothetical protein